MYTELLPFQVRVRAHRGNNVHAECCTWTGCDQMALWSVLGWHVADFPLFSPIRETRLPHLESTIWALARPHDVLVQSLAT